MNGLVLELQRDALDPNVETSILLRKALVVAKKLNLEDFQKWVMKELNGYSKADDLPPYRIIRGSIKAWNPYHGWIPYIIEDRKLGEALSTRRITQSLCELCSLVKDKKADGIFTIEYPQDVQNLFKDELLQPTMHIGANCIQGIIEHVRNNVLEWSLRLEKEGIVGENMTFSKEEKEKALTSTSIHIDSFQGILGSVANSSVTQNLNVMIQKGDFNSLSDFLSKNGISSEDVKELKRAIASDPKPRSRTLGEKVGVWLGKMIGKAASGTWKVAVDTATNLLTAAIWAYYGQ